MKNIIIVGAGFSGLSLAYHLNKKGFSVSVIDKNKRSGGLISTLTSPYGLYETAANGFLNTEKLETFLKQVNASYMGSTTQAKKKFIFRGKPLRWPLTFTETCHFIIKLISFLVKSNDLRQAQTGESVQSWSNRHFTTAVTENLIAPALQGVYAGDIEKLSAELVINPMILKEKTKRKSASSLLSALGGMGSLMKDIEKYLIRNGVQFVFGKSWSPDIASDILVIATSAWDATTILQKLGDSSA